jgi:hypothetical protein
MRYKRLRDALEEEQKDAPPFSADGVSSGLAAAEGMSDFNNFVASLTPKEKLVADILGDHWLCFHCVASVKEILEKLGGTGATEASIKTIRKRIWPKMTMWIEKAEVL